jgi:hypothetical protein
MSSSLNCHPSSPANIQARCFSYNSVVDPHPGCQKMRIIANLDPGQTFTLQKVVIANEKYTLM